MAGTDEFDAEWRLDDDLETELAGRQRASVCMAKPLAVYRKQAQPGENRLGGTLGVGELWLSGIEQHQRASRRRKE